MYRCYQKQDLKKLAAHDPYENAIAERINGILKQEFSLYSSQVGFEETCRLVEKSINAYNQIRPHSSCNYLTPDQTHQQTGFLARGLEKLPRGIFTNP